MVLILMASKYKFRCIDNMNTNAGQTIASGHNLDSCTQIFAPHTFFS